MCITKTPTLLTAQALFLLLFMIKRKYYCHEVLSSRFTIVKRHENKFHWYQIPIWQMSLLVSTNIAFCIDIIACIRLILGSYSKLGVGTYDKLPYNLPPVIDKDQRLLFLCLFVRRYLSVVSMQLNKLLNEKSWCMKGNIIC